MSPFAATTATPNFTIMSEQQGGGVGAHHNRQQSGSGRLMSKFLHGLSASLSSSSNHSRRSAAEDHCKHAINTLGDDASAVTTTDASVVNTITPSPSGTASAVGLAGPIGNASFPAAAVQPALTESAPRVPSAMQIMQAQQQQQQQQQQYLHNRGPEGFSNNNNNNNNNSTGTSSFGRGGSSGIHINFPVFSIGSSSSSSGNGATRRKKGLFRKRDRHKHSTDIQHQKAKRSSSVSFSTEPPEVAETFSRAHLTDTEKSSVWYDAHDVVKFKSAIRTVSAKIRMSARQRDEDERVAGADQKSWRLLKEYRAKTERDLKKAADDGGDNLRDSPTGGIMRSASEPWVGAPGGTQEVAAGIAEMETENTDEMEVRGLEHRTSFERQRNKVLAMKSVIGLHRKIKARRAAAATSSMPETAVAPDNHTVGNANAANVPQPQSILIRPKQTTIGAVGTIADPVQQLSNPSSSLAPFAYSSAPLNDTIQSSLTSHNGNETQAQTQVKEDSASQQSDAQELANFTSKVNRYAALVAARAAQEDFKEAYPDIVAARRQMSEQISCRPKQRLPMGSSSEGEDFGESSDDDSIIDMDEDDLDAAKAAARRISGGTISSGLGGGSRRPRLGKRKSDSELFDSSINIGESSSALEFEDGHDSFLAPLPSDLLNPVSGISSSGGDQSGLALAVPTASQLQEQEQSCRRKSDSSILLGGRMATSRRSSSNSIQSIKGDGQQLEVEDGQSRKRRSITGEIAEGLKQFILEERKKDAEEEGDN